MTAEECKERAVKCAEKASLAGDEPMSAEFLRLAAQWRAMADRCIFLHAADDAASSPTLNLATFRS